MKDNCYLHVNLITMYCSRCNIEVLGDVRFCEECGDTLIALSPNHIISKDTLLQGRYRIHTYLGGGAMGAVYKVYDIRLEKFWALKEMVASPPTEKEKSNKWQRFRQEAILLSNLHHSNLPRVTDYFSEGDRHYIVMDYIEGEDLEQFQKRKGRNGLSEGMVREISLQILDVLEYLHGQTPPILYRDLKPSNMVRRASDGKIFLVDFGIARRARSVLSDTGTAIGTEGYSPPEQYRGQSEPRSDLYTLGATMHHLLSGATPRVPFHFEPVPGIGEDMQRILDRSLEKHPGDRFASAHEMRMALETYTEQPPHGNRVTSTIVSQGLREQTAQGSLPPVNAKGAGKKPGPVNILIVTALFFFLIAAAVTILLYSNIRSFMYTPSSKIRIDPQPTKKENPFDLSPSSVTSTAKTGADRSAPEGPISPENADLIKEEIMGTIDSIMRSMEEKDLERHMSHYADKLDIYFRKKECPREFIRDDKKRAIEKYDTIKLKASNIEVRVISEKKAEAILDKEWDCSNTGVFAGKEKQRLTFIKQDNRWKIVGEEELLVYWVKRENSERSSQLEYWNVGTME